MSVIGSLYISANRKETLLTSNQKDTDRSVFILPGHFLSFLFRDISLPITEKVTWQDKIHRSVCVYLIGGE